MSLIRYCSCAFLMLLQFQLYLSLAPHEIAFLVISQKYSPSIDFAKSLKKSILNQANILATENQDYLNEVQQPTIILSHESFNSVGSWAITPILAEVTAAITTSSTETIDNVLSTSSASNTIGSTTRMKNIESKIMQETAATDVKWLILCEDQSAVDLKALIDNLKNENCTKEIFLGYPLRDSEATIIHHFAFFENPSWFLYPLFKAGVAISVPLLKKLTERVRNEKFSSDFFIDASHELSLFAWNNGKGHKLTEAPYFCLDRKSNGNGNGCAIYSHTSDSSQVYSTNSTYIEPITVNNILFAVKTYSKFHRERIPVIQKTWAKDTKHIRYFSDIFDASIPTISTNVKNTETGHCAKVMSIFKQIFNEITMKKELKSIKWIMLADDDTLLSVAALVEYLNYFNPNEDIYLGERYGYQLLSSNGFNYITGGGGIVFSLSTIKKLVNSCTCPTVSSPDDMIVALCLQGVGVEPIHSSRFHQARPMDYPREILLHSEPISFHKFWQIDPFDVYKNWLQRDRYLGQVGSGRHTKEADFCDQNNQQNGLQVCRKNSELVQNEISFNKKRNEL